jgi:hypothetical protein
VVAIAYFPVKTLRRHFGSLSSDDALHFAEHGLAGTAFSYNWIGIAVDVSVAFARFLFLGPFLCPFTLCLVAPFVHGVGTNCIGVRLANICCVPDLSPMLGCTNHRTYNWHSPDD